MGRFICLSSFVNQKLKIEKTKPLFVNTIFILKNVLAQGNDIFDKTQRVPYVFLKGGIILKLLK